MTGVAWLYTRGSERQVTLKPNAALRRAGFKQTTLCDASALSSQSFSLSEAREEIESLRADIAVKAKLLTKSAKETRAFWDALRPFADFAKYWDGLHSPDDRKFISVGDACKLTVGDVRRARSVLEMLAASNPQSACAGEEAGQSAGEVQQQRKASSALAPSKALENGPAVLADAHTNPPLSDLSSLRKGAEDIGERAAQICEGARSVKGHTLEYDGMVFVKIDDVNAELTRRAAEIRALVSGSREDGDG